MKMFSYKEPTLILCLFYLGLIIWRIGSREVFAVESEQVASGKEFCSLISKKQKN